MSTHGSSVERLTALLRERYDPVRRRARGLAGDAPVQVKEHTDAEGACQFGERFLQVLWNERRYREPMTALDGRTVTVVTPGTWNVECGPDFKNAVVTLDGQALHGDVEIHRIEADWYRHGHHTDPRYGNVILHVVWQAGSAGRECPVPCVSLADFVDGQWRSLMTELEVSVYPYARQVRPGACAVRWALSEDAAVRRILNVAGLARFQDKSTRLWRRSVAVGPAQALYEAVFDSLGYKANREAFRRLADAVPLRQLRALGDWRSREAALFGHAGLLPDPSVTRVLPGLSLYLRELWDHWWALGMQALEPRWQRAGTRPFNSPERRLAAGIAWLHACDLQPDAWLLDLGHNAAHPRDLAHCIRRELTIQGPWADCKDFTVPLRRPAALLGHGRINDMLANVFLPFLAGAAEASRAAPEVAERATETFLALPALQDNRSLREAVHRFLVPPSRGRPLLDRAAAQQGLLEIYRTFCLALHGDCSRCPFAQFDTG